MWSNAFRLQNHCKYEGVPLREQRMNEAGANGVFHGCIFRFCMATESYEYCGELDAQSNGRFSLRERSLRFCIFVLISFLSVDFGISILILSFLISLYENCYSVTN